MHTLTYVFLVAVFITSWCYRLGSELWISSSLICTTLCRHKCWHYEIWRLQAISFRNWGSAVRGKFRYSGNYFWTV